MYLIYKMKWNSNILASSLEIWPGGYKTFLCSTEHELYHAHVKMPIIVGILIFTNMINTTSEHLKA